MAEKSNKDDVDFSKGMPASHCGQMFASDKGYCRHFIEPKPLDELFSGAGECEVVKGGIKRSMWCKKFSRVVTK